MHFACKDTREQLRRLADKYWLALPTLRGGAQIYCPRQKQVFAQRIKTRQTPAAQGRQMAAYGSYREAGSGEGAGPAAGSATGTTGDLRGGHSRHGWPLIGGASLLILSGERRHDDQATQWA